MNSPVSELKSILTAETAIYDELIESAARMNEALKSRDVEAVRSFTVSYDNGFVKIESLEERRLAIADMLKESLGLSARHVTLLQVAEALVARERDELVALRAALRKRIAELSRLNVANRILLEESLSAMAKNLELVMTTRKDAAVYGQGGTLAREPLRRSIVNHTA
jgi:flagellar biosynthesis/type III secretory pathway chaperone